MDGEWTLMIVDSTPRGVRSTWARHALHHREARDENPFDRYALPEQISVKLESSESRRFEADRKLSCVRSEMGSAKNGSNQNRAACLSSEVGVQLTCPSPALEQPTVPQPHLGSCHA